MENIETIINMIVNNGVAIALLSYFVYRDNKFMTTLSTTLDSLQKSVDSVKKLIERGEKK